LLREVGVVVVAAGQSQRFGGERPKQFRELRGSPLLLHSLRPFLSHPAVTEVVVVLPPPEASQPPAWLAPLLGERLRAVAGGSTRMDSVEAGFRALGGEARIVLVHDGARPFPDVAVIDAIIAEAARGVGAIAAVPLHDTLKEAVDGASPALVGRTLARDRLWRAQTPQGFPRAMLEAALRAARADGFVGTDEASLVERTGAPIVLIPDAETNLKVTTPDDFRIAEALAAYRP
jgi:2-C-methyl-D-erythritol 4-phosphate cytidylyltransferase